MVTSFIWIMSGTLSLGYAKAPCNPATQFRDVAATSSKLKASNVRQLAPQYATYRNMTVQAIEEKYAPTGGLRCGKFFASAQVTKNSKLITTAGHVVSSRLNCAEVDLSTCVFTIDIGQKQKDYKIKRKVGDGIKLACANGNQPDDKDDWAALELEEAVPSSIQPYGVDRTATLSIKENSAVTSIGKSLDMKKPGTSGMNMSDYPKHYSDCSVARVKVMWAGDDPDVLYTNCRGGGGNSGGSLVSPSGSGRNLVGIFVGSSKKFTDAWYVPVSGAFLKAIDSYNENVSP